MSATRPNRRTIAGLRRTYRNPLTGGWTSVYDGEPAGMDTEAGRWQTVCEEHGTICSHATKRLARAFGPRPEEWCEECMELARLAAPPTVGEIVTLREPYEDMRCEVERVTADGIGTIITGVLVDEHGTRLRVGRTTRFRRVHVPQHEVVR
jgi:hypothetical protein